MQIVHLYSHLNGVEFIQVHKQQLWHEILAVIESVDANACRTKISKEKRMEGQSLYAPKEMNKVFYTAFSQLGWQESRTSYWVTENARLIRKTMQLPLVEQKQMIEEASHRAIFSYNQTDFVKERIAVEVQFGKYSFVAYDLFVKHMAFYVGDVIDVGIEILPAKTMQEAMSSGVAYYEGELYNLVRQGRGVPAVPLVLIGVAP